MVEKTTLIDRWHRYIATKYGAPNRTNYLKMWKTKIIKEQTESQLVALFVKMF